MVDRKKSRVIDAKGKIITPGLIDMHVHLREPGREDEETIHTGCEAAAAGGFTAVACMPNTYPPIDGPEGVRSIIARSQGADTRVYPIAAITKERSGKELTDMEALLEAGARAFSDDGDPVEDAQIMRCALERAKALGTLIISHAEEKSLSQGGQLNEGKVSTALGLKGIPRIAEDIMVAREIFIAGYVGSRIHIAHVSTAGSVKLIRRAKEEGLEVTCETAPHYFSLTEEEVVPLGTNAKMNPPLRTSEDVKAIKEGLADGTIDVIASDHAPHSEAEKLEQFEKAPFGIIGLETTIGLVFTELIISGVLSLMEVVAKLSLNPARILGIEGGELREGKRADLTIIDPEKWWDVNVEEFRSKSRNSPFNGRTLKGRVAMTIVGGRVIGRSE